MTEQRRIDTLVSSALKDSGIADVGLEIGETVIDSLLSNELVKAIPVLNTVVALAKGTLAIQNALFVEKVRRFLLEADKVPDKERKEFQAKMKEDAHFAAEVGQATVLVLDKADDLHKASLHGSVFAAFLRKEIDLAYLRRLQTAINAPPVTDLLAFLKDNRVGPVVRDGDYVLFAAGLLFPHFTDTQNLVPNGDFSGGHMKFYVSRLGNMLRQIVGGLT